MSASAHCRYDLSQADLLAQMKEVTAMLDIKISGEYVVNAVRLRQAVPLSPECQAKRELKATKILNISHESYETYEDERAQPARPARVPSSLSSSSSSSS